MSRLSEFIALPLAKKYVVLEAFVRLCHAWVLVRFFSFAVWKKRLGTPCHGEDTLPEIEITPEIRSIRKAINQINRGLLGPFTCLMVAMAAKDMLRRRGITSTLVLGASTNSDKDGSGMTAHAWLCVGATILLGEEERAKFNAVAYYRD